MDLLRRHPFEIEAYFDYSLVLTFALPAELLQSMLPDRLEVDKHDDLGFIAIALVQTKSLRPKGFPSWLGRDFFLSGYRIFCRFQTEQRRLRGLKILRSDTDRLMMVLLGNLFTGYAYHRVRVFEKRTDSDLEIRVESRDGQTDLALRASTEDPALPETTPFKDWREARKWCGPLPFTFSPRQDGKMVVVQGVRGEWQPKPVEVDIQKVSFFEQDVFRGVTPRLANAFLVERVPYHWKAGVLM
ncbi:MAG: DUF2071 domain-containing protein [Candidatus Eremiobacteraeota bacterium]|nr:DUF2071 domain-containing protein [Candidatus Eremiobacteraeota bacterium]